MILDSSIAQMFVEGMKKKGKKALIRMNKEEHTQIKAKKLSNQIRKKEKYTDTGEDITYD